MPTLSLTDVKLHYERDGAGDPVILLAGLLSDSASWGPLVAPLAETHEVIRPDNRSTGRTSPWNAEISVQQMVRDALAIADELGHDKVHVVGHSMGGLMAMEFAGMAPDRVQSVTIMASAPVRVPRTIAMFDTMLDIRRGENGEEMWLRALYPWAFRPAFFEDPANAQVALNAALNYPYAQSADAMEHQIKALKTYRATVRPDQIAAPTMVLFAEHDLMIPEQEGRAAFSAIPNVAQHTVEDAGHSLHWDQPEAVLSYLRDHLSRHAIG